MKKKIILLEILKKFMLKYFWRFSSYYILSLYKPIILSLKDFDVVIVYSLDEMISYFSSYNELYKSSGTFYDEIDKPLLFVQYGNQILFLYAVVIPKNSSTKLFLIRIGFEKEFFIDNNFESFFISKKNMAFYFCPYTKLWYDLNFQEVTIILK